MKTSNQNKIKELKKVSSSDTSDTDIPNIDDLFSSHKGIITLIIIYSILFAFGWYLWGILGYYE